MQCEWRFWLKLGLLALMGIVMWHSQDLVDRLTERPTLNERLMVAATQINAGEVRDLLRQGASPQACDRGGQTALMCAAYIGDLEISRILLDAGAQIDAADEQGMTALMSAAALDHVELVQLLLERGANRHLRNEYGDTALDMAREKYWVDICVTLWEPEPAIRVASAGR